MNKHYLRLELDKILNALAFETSFEASREAAVSLRPFESAQQAQRELLKTQDAFALFCGFGRPAISGIRDPRPCIRRAEAGGMLSMRELLSIAAVLRAVRTAREWRSRCERVATSLDESFSRLSPDKPLEERITLSILDEDRMDDKASPALLDIRTKIRRAELRIREQLDRIIRSQESQKYLQDAIITMRDGRFVVPVRAEYRNEIKGLVHDTSQTGATVFIEPMAVVEANNEIRMLRGKEQEEIDRILMELSALCAQSGALIEEGFLILSAIDLWFAKASLAAKQNAAVPVINSKGYLHLRRARHPLIDAKKVVPIDVELGGDYTLLIITGPNTGGKTVTIKTVGLLTLMAACGLMIPAAEGSEVSFFHRVLSDIGDEQSIEQSLSTFSSHMTNIVSVLEEADDNTLVLVDELGAGTDPVEGAALARAILEDLKQRGSRVIATTHYAELKTYALTEPGVENASCEFDVESLRPTYRLLTGIPGRSNAFAIASRLGLPERIVEHAGSYIDQKDSRFEELVKNLETARSELEREREETDRLRAEAQRIQQQAQEAAQQAQQEMRRQLEESSARAKKMIEEVRFEGEFLLEELKELKSQKDKDDFSDRVAAARQEYRAHLEALSDKASPGIQQKRIAKPLSRPLKIGDAVRILDIAKEGVVRQLADKDGKVAVQIGNVSLKVLPEVLELCAAKPQKPAHGSKITKSITSNRDRKIESEIMLRQMTVEEALLELDRYLDQAVLSGIGTVRIIHGKGTGTLRSAVQNYLRHNKHVKSFRLGVYGEGESGVTIAELK